LGKRTVRGEPSTGGGSGGGFGTAGIAVVVATGDVIGAGGPAGTAAASDALAEPGFDGGAALDAGGASLENVSVERLIPVDDGRATAPPAGFASFSPGPDDSGGFTAGMP
jgi:hypothetical protein